MRLGVDLLPLQSGGSRDRGVGRYAAELLGALATHSPGHDFVLYHYRDLPGNRIPSIVGPCVREIEVGVDEDDDLIRDRWTRLSTHNPDGLDALLMLNPFELSPGFEPPPRTPGGVPIVAVLYDLIPLLFPDPYLIDPGVRRRYERRLDTIRHYDGFLAISASTRRDAVARLGLRPDRVIALPFAIDPGFRPAHREGEDQARDGDAIGQLGIDRPFVLHVGGRDDRKNARGVIDAFAGLEPGTRRATRLVIVGEFDGVYRERLESYAADRGVTDGLVIAGVVDDDTLKTLYQRCAAFVFPSLYEGLGLPLLEAMRSGAAVIGGRNSSQVDLVGDSGLLVDPTDTVGLSRALGRLLEDREYADLLGHRAVDQTAGLSWDRVGRSVRTAIEGLIGNRSPRPHIRIRPERPRVGLVSPLPPKETGIADYAARLADSLAEHAEITLYHDGDYVPDLGLRDRRFRCVDRAAFARHVDVLPHRAVIYQMGNSWYHRSVYELLREHPGITVLHDFNLAGFHYWYGHQPDVGPGHFDRVVDLEREAGAISPDEDVFAWRLEPGGIQGAATRRGLHMNREIFERSRFVVVHSPYCRELVRASLPQFQDRTVVVPMGASINMLSPDRIAETRRQFGIPSNATVFGCFGNLTSMKMYEEAIRAFSVVRRQVDEAVLLFVGKDWEGGRARELARSEGVEDRTLFLGKASKRDYERLVASVDVGLGLRRPPTYGETSASLLDFLRSGIATIVTDVGTFRDYPASVVVRWDPERDGITGLADRMVELARDASCRGVIAEAAIDHVRTHHDWKRAARSFAELIARCQAGVDAGRFAGTLELGGPSK